MHSGALGSSLAPDAETLTTVLQVQVIANRKTSWALPELLQKQASARPF